MIRKISRIERDIPFYMGELRKLRMAGIFNFMRMVTALGLLFAMVFGMMMIPEVSALQDVGEGLPGGLSEFFGKTTVFVLALVLVLGAGSVIAYFSGIFNRR